MSKKELIQLFGEQKVRTKWDDEKQKWFFSIVDVCGVLTDQPDEEHARNYWKVLKHRLKKEGNETVTNCNQLKLLEGRTAVCLAYRYYHSGMERKDHKTI